MKKFFIANWKENPGTERAAVKLFDATARSACGSDATGVVCPPAIYLEKLAERSKKEFSRHSGDKRNGILLGAQDVAYKEKGAHRGDIGSLMMKRLGVKYAIVGHSERRAEGEIDAVINKKVKQALADGLRVVLCVGESLAVHRKGIAATKRFIKGQLVKDLHGVSGRLLIAYEPIWAIGTSNNAVPAYARDIAMFIVGEVSKIDNRKSIINVRILYGGSVNSKNIRDYVQWKEIAGALVGGASLKAGEVSNMIKKTGASH